MNLPAERALWSRAAADAAARRAAEVRARLAEIDDRLGTLRGPPAVRSVREARVRESRTAAERAHSSSVESLRRASRAHLAAAEAYDNAARAHDAAADAHERAAAAGVGDPETHRLMARAHRDGGEADRAAARDQRDRISSG